MDYLKFYDLEREPFQNDPDGSFYYESDVHRRARMLLQRGVQQHKGLSVLVGGPGCGKTTLAQLLYEALDTSKFARRMLLISHAECAHGWLLPAVGKAFGVKRPVEDGPGQLDQIRRALETQIAAGRFPVLIVDEAQLLANAEVMEEFRGLLNLTHEGRKMLSVLLFGLPELAEILKLDAPLAQRVEIRADIEGLPPKEVEAYIRHRLQRAGNAGDLFTDEALGALAEYAEGIPRVINTLADNALFEGLMSQTRQVDVSIVATAAEQLELSPDATSDFGKAPAWIEADDSLLLDDESAEDDMTEVPDTAAAPTLTDAMAEELDSLIEPAEPEAKAPELSENDFSMGSLLEDVDEDEPIVQTSPSAAAIQGEASIDLSAVEDDDLELELSEADAIDVAPLEELDEDLSELAEEEADEELLELANGAGDFDDEEFDMAPQLEGESSMAASDEPAEEAAEEADAAIEALGAEADAGEVEASIEALGADQEADDEDSGFNLGEALLDDEESEPEVSLAEDQPIDPIDLLAEDEVLEPEPAVELVEEDDTDGGEELDDLFESIQVD
jgi:type II secretory pathway predicted ATPase ExeA